MLTPYHFIKLQPRLVSCISIAITFTLAGAARTNEVTDWNQVVYQAALIAQTSPLLKRATVLGIL